MRLVEDQLIVLGAPGCGKTTYLLNKVEELLNSGVDPRKIAYVSFTKKAVEEAAGRAEIKFGFERKQLPYFRTVHSLCFQEVGANRKDVMGKTHYKEIAGILGITITGAIDEDGTGMPVGGDIGDQMLFMDNLARASCLTLEEMFQLQRPSFSWFQLVQFSKALKAYKEDTGLLDFTDMLTKYAQEGEPIAVDYAIIDEAQDLSRLQWQVLQRALRNARQVIIAGDDDQAIYKWSGADVDSFLSLEGERVILEKSWRLPAAVHRLSQKIIHRVQNRIPKNFSSRDEEGAVSYYSSHTQVPVEQYQDQTWLFLGRNTYQLSKIESFLESQGLVYSASKKKSSVKEGSYKAIVAWERLRAGNPQPGAMVRYVYDYLQVGRGVARGFKSEAVFDDEKVYSVEELTKDYGLLVVSPWHEALTGIPLDEREYYLMILRRGGPKALGRPPKIHVATIHAVKGGESENVVLMTDMAKRSYDDYLKNPDDETRVFYVGATRAKKHLHIVLPTTNMAFEELR